MATCSCAQDTLLLLEVQLLTLHAMLWRAHDYHIAQNFGGVKLWQISDFKVLVRKTLANA